MSSVDQTSLILPESLHNVLKVFPGCTGQEFAILSNITLNLKEGLYWTINNSLHTPEWLQTIELNTRNNKKRENPAHCWRLQGIQNVLRFLSHNCSKDFFF